MNKLNSALLPLAFRGYGQTFKNAEGSSTVESFRLPYVSSDLGSVAHRV